MPTITCRLDDLRRLSGLPLREGDLDGLWSLVKGEGKRYDPATLEWTIELNDTNRPDLWCPEGIARQWRAHRGRASANSPRPAFALELGGEILVDPGLEDIRPFVGGFVAKGPAVDEHLLASLIQTQEKLCENFGHRRRTLAMGIYRAGALRFPIHYLAADPEARRFVPLGDDQERSLREILHSHEKGRAYGPLIEGFARFPLLEDSAGTVLSMPPIINSRDVGEVRLGERELFVEATGTVLREVRLAMDILAANLQDRGWMITPVGVRGRGSMEGRVCPTAGHEPPLRVPLAEFSRLTGDPCAGEAVLAALRAYGVIAELDEDGQGLRARTPRYRDDYIHAVDVIEDYIISRGYDAYAPAPPPHFTVGQAAPLGCFEDHLRRLLVGLGCEEVFSNVLMSNEELTARMLRTDARPLAIANVMSETYACLRDSLLPGLYRVEAASARAAYPHRLFEVGEVCVPTAEATGTRTDRRLALLIAHAEASFADVHQLLSDLCFELRLEPELAQADEPDAIAGRSCRVQADGRVLGRLGESHPALLEAWGIRMPAAFLEFDVVALMEALRVGSSRA